MINITLEEFKSLAKKFNLIPIYEEILSDTDTPVSTFIKMTKENPNYCFLLESVVDAERWGRFSFLSFSPKQIYEIRGNEFYTLIPEIKVIKTEAPFYELKKIMSRYISPEFDDLPRFWGGLVGYAGYEVVKEFETIPDIKKEKKQFNINLPDSIFVLTEILIIFDHFKNKTKIVACIDLTDKKFNESLEEKYISGCKKISETIKQIKTGIVQENNYSLTLVEKIKKNKLFKKINSNILKKEFILNVLKAKKYIYNGDIIQVVLSQRFSRKTFTFPFDIYRFLRIVNPSPYMYYLNFGDFQLIGSSPEILVRKENKFIEIRPIAGTKPRGKNQEEEKELEKELLNSKKEKAEHIMLVDLGRNDIGKVAKFGSIKIPNLMVIEKYSHVMHLVSSVTGEIKQDYDSFDLFKACFPAGTVSGAPKIRAMEIISELEPNYRGPYAGAVGYFSYSGNMDMAINIRTILYKNNVAYIQAGAGIVADSIVEKEYQEIKNKAKALFSAIDLTEKYYEEKLKQ